MSPVPTLSPLLPSPCQSSRGENFLEKNLAIISRACYLEKGLKNAEIAQLVEQRTENPCVPGSSPGGATTINLPSTKVGGFFMQSLFNQYLFSLNRMCRENS